MHQAATRSARPPKAAQLELRDRQSVRHYVTQEPTEREGVAGRQREGVAARERVAGTDRRRPRHSLSHSRVDPCLWSSVVRGDRGGREDHQDIRSATAQVTALDGARRRLPLRGPALCARGTVKKGLALPSARETHAALGGGRNAGQGTHCVGTGGPMGTVWKVIRSCLVVPISRNTNSSSGQVSGGFIRSTSLHNPGWWRNENERLQFPWGSIRSTSPSLRNCSVRFRFCPWGTSQTVVTSTSSLALTSCTSLAIQSHGFVGLLLGCPWRVPETPSISTRSGKSPSIRRGMRVPWLSTRRSVAKADMTTWVARPGRGATGRCLAVKPAAGAAWSAELLGRASLYVWKAPSNSAYNRSTPTAAGMIHPEAWAFHTRTRAARSGPPATPRPAEGAQRGRALPKATGNRFPPRQPRIDHAAESRMVPPPEGVAQSDRVE